MAAGQDIEEASRGTDPDGHWADSLAEFLRREVYPDASLVRVAAVERPRGGMSWETFFFDLELTYRSGRRVERIVIKRAPGRVGPLGPFDAAKDAAIFSTLYGHVPVPRLLAYSGDPTVFERPFTATAFVEGESDDLYRIERWPLWQRNHKKLGLQIIEVMAAMRRFRWQSTEIADVLGPRGSSTERIRAMVDWYAAPYRSPGAPRSAAQVFWTDVANWLQVNVPAAPEAQLVVSHGDFRFGNMIWRHGRVAAVVDWERAGLSDPMSDLGFFCMPMARRRRPELMGMALPIEDLLNGYFQATGKPADPRRLQYYMIFWQFIEGSLASRPARVIQAERTGGSDVASRRTAVGSLPLGPNLHVRQTAPLIDAFEEGRHDVV